MRKSLLVVEDDDCTREALRHFLLDEGFDVREAVDGQEAIKVLTIAPRPDVVLLDLELPIVDGRGVLAWLKENGPTQPVVLASGMGFEHVRRAAELEDLPFVTKPINVDHLLEAIALAISAREGRSTGTTRRQRGRAR